MASSPLPLNLINLSLHHRTTKKPSKSPFSCTHINPSLLSSYNNNHHFPPSHTHHHILPSYSRQRLKFCVRILKLSFLFKFHVFSVTMHFCLVGRLEHREIFLLGNHLSLFHLMQHAMKNLLGLLLFFRTRLSC